MSSPQPIWKTLLPLSIPLFVALTGGIYLKYIDTLALEKLNIRVSQEAANRSKIIFEEGNIKCTDDHDIADKLLITGQRLGVNVVSGLPKLPGKDATYEALHGRLGTITLRDRVMQPEAYCQLISHEFIHVLQHLNSDLKGVNPLGWDVPIGAVKRFGSLQEAEAYSHQNQAGLVLKLLTDALENKD